jgi:hypothetical protein
LCGAHGRREKDARDRRSNTHVHTPARVTAC